MRVFWQPIAKLSQAETRLFASIFDDSGASSGVWLALAACHCLMCIAQQINQQLLHLDTVYQAPFRPWDRNGILPENAAVRQFANKNPTFGCVATRDLAAGYRWRAISSRMTHPASDWSGRVTTQ